MKIKDLVIIIMILVLDAQLLCMAETNESAAKDRYNVAKSEIESSNVLTSDETDSGSIHNRVTKNAPDDKGNDMVSSGQLLSQAGRFAEAEELFKYALAYWQTTPPAAPRFKADCLNNLGLLYEKQQKFDQALPCYQQALTVEETLPGDNQSLALKALTLDNMAQVYRRQSKFSEAEPLYKQALEIEDKIMAPNDQDHAITRFNLSLLYLESGQYSLSEPLMTKSMSILKKTLGETNPDYLNLYPYYLDLLRKTNRGQQADELQKKYLHKG